MRMILPSRPRFPDTLVRLIPILGYEVSEADQRVAHIVIEFPTVERELRGRIDHLAINVELQLFPRGISYAHRPRSTISP